MRQTPLDSQQIGRRLELVDDLLMRLLARRMELAQLVARNKHHAGEPILRLDTEDERLKRAMHVGKELGLNPNFCHTVLYAVIGESCKVQVARTQDKSLEDLRPQSSEDWYNELKQNLLELAGHWSESYDLRYEREHFATKSLSLFEQKVIGGEIIELPARRLLVDLGCATGRMCAQFRDHFDRVIGYDISPQMIEVARRRTATNRLPSEFEAHDVEQGIPLPDDAASFVVMNLGTASDIREIDTVIEETKRVLAPGGRFAFSFYNRDALVYQWDFLPWSSSLSAMINPHDHCLEVYSEETGLKAVYARPYSVSEASSLFAEHDLEVRVVTYPTVSAILPQSLFEGRDQVQKAIHEVDESLVEHALGAYILATGTV